MDHFGAVRGFFGRLGAIIIKEVLQLARDRLTFAHDVRPARSSQLMLFGYRHQHRSAPPADRGAVGRPDDASPAPSCPRSPTPATWTSPTGPRPRPRPTRCCSAARCSSSSPFPSDFTRRLVRGERAPDPDRRRRHRSDGGRQPAGRRRSPRSTRRSSASWSARSPACDGQATSAVELDPAPPLQSRGQVAPQHRARPARR